jgi:putative membrane-bound dehydrogenase-like protein
MAIVFTTRLPKAAGEIADESSRAARSKWSRKMLHEVRLTRRKAESPFAPAKGRAFAESERRHWTLIPGSPLLRFHLVLLAALLPPAVTGKAADDLGPRVPPGFVVERAATDSSVRFPMFAAFDDRGRLFVAESSGLDLYAEIAAGTRKCRIRLLEDRDGDGRFEASRIFADRLVFPMGLAWRDGRLYIADPPDLIALEDADGDGLADRRTVILTGFGHTDNGSLHGLTFGPDGWLYMTMGMPDGYRLAAPGGRFLEGKSGALLRCRPDGSDREVVCRGFVNLVEVVFLPGGEAVGTDNWFQEPAGGARDALVHLVEGALYPYVPDEGTPQPVTGDPLPPLARFPAVALSGLERYRGSGFPAAYRGNLFTAQHNSRAVGRHVLVPDGSTFRSEDSDFLTSDDPDFHPSDVLEDADGSLLVVDTGAWYIQHCPTGRIRPAQSRGAIYRVRWAAAARPHDPRGLSIDWPGISAEQVVRLLSDPRPAVRDQAVRMLSARGASATPALGDLLCAFADASVRGEAVRALTAIADPAALPLLRRALSDVDADVASAGARALGRRADRAAAQELARLVAAGHPRTRLAAAEALARCGDAQALTTVWDAVACGPDPFLAHALTHAAHRLADAAALEAALDRPEPRVQAAALRLLDQSPRPRGHLRPGPVLARASAPDPGLRRAALWVLRRHPEWANNVLDHIRRELGSAHLLDDRLEGMAGLILAFEGQPAVADLLAAAAADPGATAGRRIWALTTMARSRLPEPPGTWANELTKALHDSRPELRLAAVRAATTFRIPRLDPSLLALVDDAKAPTELRLEALRAALPRHPAPSAAAFDLLLSRLGAAAGPADRLAAAALLGRARLDDARRLRLLGAVRSDPLIAPDTLLAAFAPPLGEQAASAWLDYLEASLRAGWRPVEADLRSMLDAVPSIEGARRAALLEIIKEGAEARRARLAEFEPLLRSGDPVRGRALFFGTKAACATCHRVGDSGGLVGPDLTKVGAIRSGHDLLESILFPGSTFAQGYESYAIATADGRVLTGLIVRQDAVDLVLRDASGAETRLPRAEIEDVRRSETPLMPDGLGNAMSREEFRDLLAFLKSLR